MRYKPGKKSVSSLSNGDLSNGTRRAASRDRQSIILLPNGVSSKGSNSLRIYNTCPFDSIFSIIAAMYADFNAVAEQIDRLDQNLNVNSDFLHMINTMFRNGDRESTLNSLLQQRNKILLEVFPKNRSQNASDLNCAGNVNVILEKILPKALYSYIREKCQCSQDNPDVLYRCFLDIDFDKFRRKSIRELNQIIVDSFARQKRGSDCKRCKQVRKIEFSNFVMIDLQSDVQLEEISLNDIPKQLTLNSTNFKIFACIMFIPPITGIGHYVSHITKNNVWEQFDDLKKEVIPSDENVKIQIHVLFYVKENLT